MTHLRQGLGLDLTDAFPGHVEVPANLVEGGRFTITQAVTHLDDGAFTLVETGENVFQVFDVELRCNQFKRSYGIDVLDEVADGCIVFANRFKN